MSDWYVYIVRCRDDTFYTGITKDIDRRIEEHNSSDKLGARYTRSRRPVRLVYTETLPDRRMALKRELEVKRLGRKGKELLLLS